MIQKGESKHLKNIVSSFISNFLNLLFLKVYLKIKGKKIVVINLIEHFGDVIACEPISRYVRQKFPNDYIIWNIKKSYSELVKYNPNINKVMTVYCLTEWILLKYFFKYDKIFDLHIQGRICPTCGIPLKKDKSNLNITLDNYFNFGNIITAFGATIFLPPIEDQPVLYIPEDVKRNIDSLALPKEYITIHCSSNEAIKNYSNLKWKYVIETIISQHSISIIEIGISSELEISSSKFINLCNKLSLLETAEVIKRSQIFIGIDSGPAHMANAVGTFGIILLGEFRNFIRYMPYSGNYMHGKNVTIIYADDGFKAAEINPEIVINAVNHVLERKRVL